MFLFPGGLLKNDYTDMAVCQHIRKTDSFCPSLEFEYKPTPDGIFLTVETLLPAIEERLKAMLSRPHLW